MHRMVQTILQQYGTAIRISGVAGERTVMGFFQPVRSKSLQSIVQEQIPLGQVSRRQYIFIGPGDLATGEGEVLTLGEKQYLLSRVEKYHYGNQPVYTWGLCVEKGEDDAWGS